MSDAEERFESARFNILNAQAEMENLNNLIAAFQNTQPNTIVREYNSQTGMTEIKVKFAPITREIRGKTSSILKDIRDALDQVVAAATVYIKGGSGRGCHFPFGENPSDLEKSLSLRKASFCKGIAEELFEVLRRCEPYPTGDGYKGGNNSLKLLGKVSGGHKHAVTLTSAVQPQTVGVGNGIVVMGSKGGSIFPFIDSRRKGEAVILELSKGGSYNGEITVTTYIAFDNATMRDIPVDGYLTELLASTSQIVNDIEAEARRLGPRASQ